MQFTNRNELINVYVSSNNENSLKMSTCKESAYGIRCTLLSAVGLYMQSNTVCVCLEIRQATELQTDISKCV